MHMLDRFLITSRLKEADMVPAAPFATGSFVSWFAGIPENRAIEYWRGSPRKKLAAQLTLIRAFPGAMFWPGIYPSLGMAVETSALGCEIAFPENASPSVRTPALKNVADVDKIEIADPHRDGLMPTALETYEYMVSNVPSKLKREFGYGQWALTLGPTDVAALSMGYDKFLTSLYRYPDAIHKLMKTVTETIIAWVRAQQEAIGSDLLVFIGGDSDSFLDPTQFEAFAYPYLKRICRVFRKKNNAVLYHNDGDTTHLLHQIRNIGANMFNFGQEMNVASVKRETGDRMCLVGGLNSIGVMLKGTAEEVDLASKKAILEGAKGGGFVLSQEGAMAAHTPTENIWAMVKASEKYGKYPLASRKHSETR